MSARVAAVADELPVITKTYDLLHWTILRVEKFPRTHRFTLGTRLQTSIHDVLDLLIEARFAADKAALLHRCSIQLEQIRMTFRISCELGILPIRSHEYASRCLLDISRQIGGWRRQQEKRSE